MTDETAPPRNGIRVIGLSLALWVVAFLAAETLIAPLWSMWTFRRWVPTPCVVLESGIREWGDREDRLYIPAVRFAYTAGARSYESDEFALHVDPRSKSEAAAIAESLPVGAATTCRVSPHVAGRAVLRRGPEDAWIPLWISWALVPVAAVLARVWIREMRRPRLG